MPINGHNMVLPPFRAPTLDRLVRRQNAFVTRPLPGYAMRVRFLGGMMMKSLLVGVAALALSLGSATPTLAQTQPAAATEAIAPGLTAADLEIIRSELRADKRKATAESLNLTDAEAAKFWPIYDKYINELTVINNAKYALVKEYSEKFGSYSDKQATDFITRWLDVDIRAAKLRSKYVPIVGKVLPGVKSASFFQVDRRLAMLINLGIASQLPILQNQ
jgi:hypothetical protein